MNITKLSERSRLQRIIREAPDDIDARKALASLFLESGDLTRAAAELMSISRVHVSRGEGGPARDACRQALGFDAGNLELRLLLAQIHARFPAGEDRAAAPIVEAVAEPTDGASNVDFGATRRAYQVVEALGGVPVSTVDATSEDIPQDDMFAIGGPAQSSPAGSEMREQDSADISGFRVGLSDLIEIPDAVGYKDEITAPTGAISEVPDEIPQPAEAVDDRNARSSRGAAFERAVNPTQRESQAFAPSPVAAPRTPVQSDVAVSKHVIEPGSPTAPDPIRTAPIAVQRVTPPRPKSAPPKSSVRASAKNEAPLPDPFESSLDGVEKPEGTEDFSGLGVDDETPTPPQFSGQFPRVADSTRKGAIDLSPRSPSGGFEQRVSAMERFRGETPPARTVVGPAPDHFILSDLPSNLLTDRLPKAAREALFQRLLYVEYTDEAAVMDAGRELDALMLVQDGVVRVINGPLVGDATDLCRMSDGELIGAFEFLTRSQSRVSLQAEGRVGMLELPRAASDELRREDAQIGDAIRSILRERLVSNLMDRAPIFASVNSDQRRELASRFFAVDVESAEPILQQGEINRRLFLLQSGELVVDSRGGKGGRMTLHPGDFFGFVSTLLGRPVQVAVVASAPSSLLVLPEQEVYRLVAGNKGVARAARREAVERGDQPISVHSIGGLGGLVVRRPGID